ncbi:MAG: outer membrane protein assembly factor BamA [Rhodobacteraceae bacterium]|nr:outer membrane protein assembly factor BamA [Paracoccaceae bacterium]
MRVDLLQKTRASTLIASLFLGVSALAVTAVMPESAAAQISGRFSAILVSGNQSIPDQTVASLSGLDLSQSLSPADINAAIRRLIGTGLFADVDIRSAAGRLVIAVVENPTIAIVNFEGNKGISDSDLESIVTSAARRPLDRPTIEADARRIAEAYQQRSRYSATVTPLIIPLADGRSNLVFQITEGRTEQIQSVSFTGNQSFTDKRLRRTVASSESGLLNFLYNTDNYSPERAAADQQALLSFYRDRGYPDVEVTAGLSEFALDRDGFFLTYSIREGASYDFGDASVSTNLAGVEIGDFNRFVRLRSGRTYSGTKVEKVVEAIEEEATRLGFPFLRAIPRITKNEADGSVDINFELVNGSRIYVERIDIRGNSQTLDRVIRREFDMAEGDAYNPRKVRQAENALRALRFFSQLQVSSRPGSTPESVILDVQVADQATGSFNFGANYSTDSGISGTFSITESNFLGRGQRFSLNLSYGETSKVASFGFTEPKFLGRDLAAGFDVFYRQSDRSESSFQTTEIGISPSITFPLSERTRMSFTYDLISEEIRDTVVGTTSPITIAEEGTEIRSALRLNLSHDRRNSPLDPSAGYILRFGAEYAGLGGSANYTKATARAKGYFNLFDEALIFSADLEGGALYSNGGAGSRITDRFFLGGGTFRGFNVGGLGPRDDDGGTVNDSLGGNYYAIARLDASFPIGLPQELGIRGGLFLDAGSVWGMDGVPVGASGAIDTTAQLRASAGFALYWDTAIGPLVFNWANPFLTVAGDETQSFSVSVKTSF